MKKMLFILFLAICTSCNNNSKQQPEVTSGTVFSKTEQIQSVLIGRKLESLTKLISLNINDPKPILLFYFTGTDCFNCIKKGFNYINKFSESKIIIDTYVIDANLGINLNSEELSFEDKSYPDSGGVLKKELLYADTPIFITYSINNGIESIYIIPTREDEVQANKYFDSLKNYNN